MSVPKPPNGPTASPWAERFSSFGDTAQNGSFLTWGDSSHSGVAPEIPRIDDPIHYLDVTGVHPYLITPSDEDLDKLFRTEEFQRRRLFGMRTWESATLNSSVQFSPQFGIMSGGHLLSDVGEYARTCADIYNSYKIQVDETRWLPFLRKCMWFDWFQTSPPSESSGGQVWSVDDPKLWNELSMGLELADRILNALIDDEHPDLRMLLFGRIELWKDAVPPEFGAEPFPNAQVLISYEMECDISKFTGAPCQNSDLNTVSSPKLKQRLIDLLTTHLWGFVEDQKSVEARDESPPGVPFTSISLINTRQLDALLNTQLTLAERCSLHVYLAISMIHELCHAIINSRWQNYVPGRRNINVALNYKEPIVDCEGISEIGYTMEQCFFGGSMFCIPSGVPLGTIIQNIPNALQTNFPHVPGNWLSIGAPVRVSHVSSSWTSRLLSEAFWKDAGVPQKSANCFHRPSLFVNETPYRMDANLDWSSETKVDDSLPGTSDGDRSIVQAWHERHALWNTLRAGWYEHEISHWKASPWFWTDYRLQIDKFAEAFSKRDQIRCGIAAQELVMAADWEADDFHKYMPQSNTDLNSRWMFHCIGLLMMASIPIRFNRMRRIVQERPVFTYSAAPSREAAALGFRATVDLTQGGEARTESVESSELFDQVHGRGRVNHGFSQFDYLTIVIDMISGITSYALVDISWLDAIRDAYKALLADREGIRDLYFEGQAARWATNWFFKVPKYTKRVGRFENGSFRELKFDSGTNQWEYAV